MSDTQYTDDDCLNALRAAAEYLGKSPTRREYESLAMTPVASVVTKRFGGWNEAKREAGLEICRGGNPAKPVRSSFFERIDTKTKAYWLGFLFGDGSLLDREYGYRVQLSQRTADLDHLRTFKRTVRAENALIEDGNTYHVRIGDREFADNLREHGFTTEKGHDGSLPELESWFLRRAFVRGLADADGYYGEGKWTITDNNDKRLRKLRTWIPFDADIVNEEYEGRTWAYLRVSGRTRLPALYHWLFPRRLGTEPAMPRKRERAVGVLTDALTSDP